MNCLVQVLDILGSDETLSKLLKKTVRDSRIYPLEGRTGNCISYKYTTVTDDKIKQQNRLEIRCFSEDIATSYEILDRVKELLLTFGDNQLTDNILNCNLNGGITPQKNEFTNSYYTGAFFILTTRKDMI